MPHSGTCSDLIGLLKSKVCFGLNKDVHRRAFVVKKCMYIIELFKKMTDPRLGS